MSDEKNESRISIEDLPQAEEELTTEEAREVKGGRNVSHNNTHTGTITLNTD